MHNVHTHHASLDTQTFVMNKSLARLLSPLGNSIQKRLFRSKSSESLDEVSDSTMAAISTPVQKSPVSHQSPSTESSPCSKSTSTSICSKQPGKKKKKSKSKSQTKLCVPGCKHKGKDSCDDMVQCHICQMWAHFECIGEKEADIIGLWSCSECRNIAKGINKLISKMSTMESNLAVVQENNASLSRLFNEKNKLADELRDENTALREQIAGLREELTCLSSVSTQSGQIDLLCAEIAQLKELVVSRTCSCGLSKHRDPAETEDRVILLGCDLNDVGPVMTSDGRRVEVHTASIQDMPEAIDKVSAANKPSEIMIVSGLLPHGSEDEKDTMKDHIDTMVSKVASLKCKATISGILPARAEKAREVSASLNLHVSAKCKDAKIAFVDNDRNFLFRDGSPDPATLSSDLKRLSVCGTRRVLTNLSLTVAPDSSRKHSATNGLARRPPRQRQAPGKSDPVRVSDSSHQTYRHTTGQCNICGESNHVTKKCRHSQKVLCRTCGERGHKSKHHY